MDQIERDKKTLFIMLFIIALILILTIMSILNYLSNQEMGKSHKLSIFNEHNERIGIFEIYRNNYEGSYKSAPYLPLEMTVLLLDNRDNRIQFSNHFMFNSTESNFSVEFFDNNGNSRIDSEDYFIFYNYTEDVWIRVAHWGYGSYYSSKIHID